MAYATKYLFKWQSAKGTTREIRVLKNGYSGSVIQRALGRAPILKKQKNGTVFGTSLEFYAECQVEGEFTEFYTTNPKAYKVQLYAGNDLLWQGYVTPELYSEPDIAPPFDVQVIATDGIGELKLYDFEPQGTVTLRSIFTYLLGYTGLGTDVYLISSLKAGSSGAGALLEKTINLDYMAGESCYDVLTYLLDTLHATITWWKGAWIVARETNVTFTSGKVRYFNTAGNSALLAGSVQTLGKMYTNDVWPVGQLSRKVDPAKKSVTVQAPWHTVRGLANPDMDRDASWVKNSGATFESTHGCYSLPYLGASSPGYACIKQDLQMAGLRVPMSFTLKGTGLGRIEVGDPRTPYWTNGAVIAVIVYTVGTTTYILRQGEEGFEWKEGPLPNFDLFYFSSGGGEGIPSKSFDTALADRIRAEELTIDSIPTFDQSGSFPAGTLTVYIAGLNCYLYGAEINVILPKGYKDRLHLDNGARGEGEEVEVAIGRETSDIDYYKAFMQGILLDSGSLITSFKDDAITTGMDFLAFISRDYARSFALPRIVRTGTVQLEAAVQFPPLVLTKAAVDYWLETWSWNMYEDELDITARSLPTASITVDSEVISEASGTTSGGSGSGGGSSSMSGGGSNYFEPDDDYEDGIKLKDSYDGLRIPGLRFGEGREDFDLEVRNVAAEGETPVYALYTPLTLITGGDQIIGDGTPGGGEPTGVSYLHELLDVDISNPTNGQILSYDGTLQKWVNADAPEDGVQSVAGVGPDADGDVDADALKSALGLKSAAYREEGYFARASHSHGISDITGLDGNLSTISSALQSLQAQIDSVATRDSFNELTASSAFIDMLAADDIYANRYHFTPDIFFSFELIDGVPAVRLNAALITAGDQVLGNGTPGGGGGGGSSYLHELLDVDDDLSSPVVGTLLQWYGGEWVGTTFSDIENGDLLTYAAGKWSNVPRTSVGIVTDATSSAHGLMSAADKSKLDDINTTHISHGETAYNALDIIGPALQSLQAQIDSVASRDAFDELTATALYAEVLSATDIYGTLHGALEGNASTATDADKLDGQHGSYYATASAVSTLQGYFTNGVANNADKLDGIHAADLFSALGSGAATNLSLTIGGTTRTATLYATYDSASENISDKFGIVGGALQSLQAQIDSVASRSDISDFEATTEAKMDFMCDLMRSLQSQIDSVSTRINDGSDAYFDILSVGKAIYGDVLITTGEQTLSDERFKTITREIVLSAEQIASCRAVAFDWKHKPGSSFGSIAQDWQKILPEAVSDTGDELYLFYSQSAAVAVTNLAREVVRLKKALGID